MPPPVAPQTRPDLEDYIRQNVYTNAQGEIDGDQLQRVLLHLAASFANLLTDGGYTGGIGNPDYQAVLAALRGKTDKDPVTGQLVLTQAPPAAPQWKPGKQTGGALVFDQGMVYRVVQNIANGQAAPAGNVTYYQPIGPLLGTGSGASDIPVVMRLSATQWYLNDAAQALYNAGKLLYLYDDQTGYRVVAQARQFGIAPTNTASQNATGIGNMRSTLQGQGQ